MSVRYLATACLCLGISTWWKTIPAEETSALVQLETAQHQPMRESLTAYGTVEYAPEETHVLDVQAESLVTHVAVDAGQSVQVGDVLLELTATINARAELDNAQAGASFAVKDLEHVKELRKQQLATNAEVQAAEEAAAKAQRAFASMQQRLSGNGQRILRADMRGIVDAVMVHEGEIAAAGVPLVRLAHGDRMRVRFGVEPEDLARIKPNQTVIVRALYSEAPEFHGQVKHIFLRVDPKTRLADVVVPLTAAAALLPGTMVQGDIVLSDRNQVLSVPRLAVLTQEDRTYVYKAVADHAQRCWVETGVEDANRIEIRSGLQAGEQIVITGNHELQDGMRLRIEAQP